MRGDPLVATGPSVDLPLPAASSPRTGNITIYGWSTRWQEVRGGIVARAGGEEAITQVRNRNRSYIDGHRLAERRKALGLAQAQAQAAERMGVTKSRVSQIERGEVSTIDAVARYVQAVGGTIQISAVFGDDHYILRGTATEAA
jgi:DNA-binding XRE family transcriptional regulator